MKKILIITLMYFLFATLFTNVVSANFDDVFDDSVDGKQIFKTEVLPSKMGPKSVIEFISDTEFIVIEGYVVDGYDVDVISNMAKDSGVQPDKYPDPVKGLIITYATDGYLLDLIYPEGQQNPLLIEKSLKFNTNNIIELQSQNIEGYLCASNTLLALWGNHDNRLYNCTVVLPVCPTSEEHIANKQTTVSPVCSTTINTRIGAGRATTFSDPIGQANIVLKKGAVATKLAYDNVTVGKVLSVKTKTVFGVNKTVNMIKNDAGEMPDAVLDIWKTGVEYWGYTWESWFSMPHRTTYQYAR